MATPRPVLRRFLVFELCPSIADFNVPCESPHIVIPHALIDHGALLGQVARGNRAGCLWLPDGRTRLTVWKKPELRL